MKKFFLLFFFAVLICSRLSAREFIAKTAKDSSGFSYEYVTDDPFHARIYTLKNGMKVYLSRIPVKPRVYVRFLVRAGLADSPADATGLAHYLEHLMFKGTDRIGALDYQKEKPLLDRIEHLYEARRAEKDPAKKAEIYKEIDRLSSQAAKYASAGEYSKLIGSMGGTELNAFTGLDVTCYVVDIPANELDHFLYLESERIRKPVIRLFHTELEAVFQEFNHGQDKDSRVILETLLSKLFPTHPYGWTPLIGKPQHLKEPSIRLVREFVEKYYVPGNMALALTGDLDFDSTIRTVSRYFSVIPSGRPPERKMPVEQPMTENITADVTGPDAESVTIAFRVEKGKRNELLGTLLSSVLHNGYAGLFDMDLNRAQKLGGASSSFSAYRDYSWLTLRARPRAGQTLDQAASLMLAELDKVKKGDFDPELLPAVIANWKKNFEEGRDDPESAAWTYLDSYVSGRSYAESLREIEEVSKYTKKDISSFAKGLRYYVRLNKLSGKAVNRVKVEKPQISKVELNAGKHSAFGKAFLNLPAGKELPLDVVDFKKDFTFFQGKNGAYDIFMSNKKAPANDVLFQMDVIRKAGAYHDSWLPIAVGYLNYLGTAKYSANALRREFYKHALSFSVWCGNDQSGISISGFGSKLPQGAALVRHFMENVKADPAAWKRYAMQIIKNRKDSKKKLATVFRSLNMYAAYGPEMEKNPFLYDSIISDKDLLKADPAVMVEKAKKYLGFSNAGSRIFNYVGPHKKEELDSLIAKSFFPADRKLVYLDIPPKKEFQLQETAKSHVYLIPFDSVQLFLGIRSRTGITDLKKRAVIELYNQYFGAGGLDAIVFQEIREARGLAYSAYAFYIAASEKGKYDAFASYVGTQPDKLFDAADAMLELFRKMPRREVEFRQAKINVIKSILSGKLYGNLYPFYRKMEKLGLDRDCRPQILAGLRKLTMEDLEKFSRTEISGRTFDVYIAGDIKTLDRKKLEKYGKVVELKPEQTFGY